MLIFFEFIKRVGEIDKMRACRACYLFFPTSLMNSVYKSTNVRFYLSYDIEITLTSHFCRKTLYLCHYVRNVVMDVITFPKHL